MRKTALVLTTLFVLLATTAAPIMADGGPVIHDRDVWEALEEGQQLAVVALNADGTVHTDLFVSLIDHTGVSHEITFFLPLGWAASDFDVFEEVSSSFETSLTDPLDYQLQQAALDEQQFATSLRWSLLPGSFLISGGWTWPLLAIFALTGCGAGAPQPVEVFYTDSSQVSIYGIDENTDLAALIATTGLDPSVQETLRAFEGQQIAVVSMRTQPPAGGDTSGYRRRQAESQLGLHLQWTSHAVGRADGGWEHYYPLGTGGAWARPIPLTRVYVTAPAGVDFRVGYPIYGADHSRYHEAGMFGGRVEPNIYYHLDETGYAVDHLITSRGHIWRGIYTQANPTADLHIIQDAEATDLAHAQVTRRHLRSLAEGWSWLAGIALASALWVICWRYVMPSHLGRAYRWFGFALWRDAIAWALVYPVSNGLALGALAALGFAGSNLIELLPGEFGVILAGILIIVLIILGALVALLGLLGLFSALLFALRHRERRAQATKGYVKVVALSNVSYLVLGVIYAIAIGWLVG